MTEFDIDPKYFGKWFHQNEAKYTGDFVEGVLLDNFVIATKRGFADRCPAKDKGTIPAYRVEAFLVFRLAVNPCNDSCRTQSDFGKLNL